MQNEQVKNKSKINFDITRIIKTQVKPLLMAFLLVAVVALLGGFFTNTRTSWFNSLFLPEFYPPSQVFGIAWSVVYFLMAVGLYRVMVTCKLTKDIKKLYIINGILNILWVVSFFTLNSLALSVVVFVMLLVSAVLLSKNLYCANKFAFYLSIPYVFWLVFAFMLNYAIFLLN